MRNSVGKLSFYLLLVVPGFCANQVLAASMPSGAINVKKMGAVGNGTTDDTAAIQKAVNAVGTGGIVWVPAGKYLIDATKHINLKSNMKFQMDPLATLITKPNSAIRYYVINIAKAKNVEVSGGSIIGDSEKHTGKKGEWGMGVNVIAGSSNVNIHDMKISKMWGDGVYVGDDGSSYVNYVVINRVISTQNRRQGLSITNANHVQVLNSEFSYTKGTLPEYGIDIEPNDKTHGASDILIQGCYLHHNHAGGLQAYIQSKNLVIKDNNFEYGFYGIYTVGSHGATITGNVFAHHKYQGVSLNKSTSNYTLSSNLYSNNSTRAVGIMDPDTNAVVSITGSSSKTNPHYLKDSSSSASVKTNRYQR